jgi:uncharacterized protein YdeI (YjbR/CyaY-like superfamily)
MMQQMNEMNPKVDGFLKTAKKWQQEFEKLRTVCLDCGLTEELKWGKPCYTFQESNIVLIHGFKDYCALLFFKGALLKDPKGILVQQTEECAGGAPDSVHQYWASQKDGTCSERLYQGSH